MKTVVSLRELLDVPEPFDLVIHDPMGKSEFEPMDLRHQGMGNHWIPWMGYHGYVLREGNSSI